MSTSNEASGGDATQAFGDGLVTEDGSALARDVLIEVLGAVDLEAESSPVHLGRYVLVRRLGTGGMGEVFEARHVDTDERVALKTLSRPSARQLYRFKQEFRVVADVPHPNLVRLHELEVTSASTAYFTMELVKGVPFVDWVRAKKDVGELPDLRRLEDALSQLVSGLAHLHANGCVHRDIKPSNVLACEDGRIVILDFGLVLELDAPEKGITRDREMIGTPAFMAPEQVRGERAGPAVDYYALGVMLYESLTGRLPHEGETVLELLVKKEDTVKYHPVFEQAPPRLRDICSSLLSTNPDERTRGWGLASHLAAHHGSSRTIAKVFVGRDRELGVLEAGLKRVQSVRIPVVAHVRGRSGHGKTAMTRKFASTAREERNVVVLESRCRERETVPYKGIDGIVDALSIYLRHLPEPWLEALRPPSVDALVRVFPILSGLWPAEAANVLGPHEIRRASWLSLREILFGIAKRNGLVVHADNFQWSDLDSVELLETLLEKSRPVPMLLMLSYRSEAKDSEPLQRLRRSEIIGDGVAKIIDVGPLSPEQSIELANMLLRLRGTPGEAERLALAKTAESITLRAGGVPFFISQMVFGGGAEIDLDDLLYSRLDGLSGPMRAILDVVAVSGGPTSSQMVLDACPGATIGDIHELCATGLLVSSGDMGLDVDDERIETAQDRIREAALERLAGAEKSRLHQLIGEWLIERSDELFIAVDHLNSGVTSIADLDDQKRASLVDLNRRVGQRALDAGAWVAARRYFEFAFECVSPWLAVARQGQGEYTRCSEVAFGLARARAMCLDQSDEMFEELLSWSLPVGDRGRFVTSYLGILTEAARWAKCFERGVHELSLLGEKPPRPSRLRMRFELVFGWRAIRSLNLESLAQLPNVDDDRTRLIMGVMGNVASAAVVFDPLLAFILLGRHARMTMRHGRHEWTVPSLVNFGIGVCELGEARAAGSLCDDLFEFARQHPMSVGLGQCQIWAGMLVYPRSRSLQDVGESFVALHQRCVELGDARLTQWALAFAGVLHLDAGTNLYEVLGADEEMRSRAGSADIAQLAQLRNVWLMCAQCLIEGSDVVPLMSPDAMVNVTPMSRYMATLRQVQTAVFFGDYARAGELCSSIRADYMKIWFGWYHQPIFSLFDVIVLAELGAKTPGMGSRRANSIIRARRGLIRRWAADCPENYKPMLDIVEGEIRGLEGKFEQAMAAYERGVTGASSNRMLWLAGLGSERLARLARRLGHRRFAQSAYEDARRFYKSWGADAVVRRIENEAAES